LILEVSAVFDGPIEFYSTAQKRMLRHGEGFQEQTGRHEGADGRIIAPAA
jgi:hypothetical protein